MPPVWSLRQSLPSDAPWIAELRAQVMRPDLERLGRWDPVRVRQRFLTGFHPAHTFVIEVGASAAGVIAVRPESDEQWIEHFYLAPEYQGQGLGSAGLLRVMMEQRDHRPFRLNVLQGSPARRLYERNGFVHEHEDSIDVFLVAESDQVVDAYNRALATRPRSRRSSDLSACSTEPYSPTPFPAPTGR